MSAEVSRESLLELFRAQSPPSVVEMRGLIANAEYPYRGLLDNHIKELSEMRCPPVAVAKCVQMFWVLVDPNGGTTDGGGDINITYDNRDESYAQVKMVFESEETPFKMFLTNLCDDIEAGKSSGYVSGDNTDAYLPKLKIDRMCEIMAEIINGSEDTGRFVGVGSLGNASAGALVLGKFALGLLTLSLAWHVEQGGMLGNLGLEEGPGEDDTA